MVSHNAPVFISVSLSSFYSEPLFCFFLGPLATLLCSAVLYILLQVAASPKFLMVSVNHAHYFLQVILSGCLEYLDYILKNTDYSPGKHTGSLEGRDFVVQYLELTELLIPSNWEG